MAIYNLDDYREETAIFINYENGYCTFELENKEEIIFEEINRLILNEFNLKDKALKGNTYVIGYRELIEDDEDLVIYRLEKLKKIKL